MIKLFQDPISQPCRAVLILLDINKIPYEPILIDIFKGDQKTNQELRAANPNCQIPTLIEGDFTLYESSAIMKYICNSREVSDNWYPKDPKKRAKVDQYLDWHQGNIRISTAWFLTQYVTKKSADDPEIVKIKAKLVISLTMLDTITLKDNHFIIGDVISIADLQLLCELCEFWLVGKNLYDGFPKLEAWVKRCVDVLGTHFEIHHKAVFEGKEKAILGLDPEPLK